MNEYPNADLALVRRLERAEATANAAFVEARAVVAPKVGAAWIDVAGVYAMFDGVGSPITQTFGLGLFADCLEPEFDRLEAFFDAFGSATVHEVSSFAPDATTALLRSRGYAPIEESVVLVRPTAVDVAPSTSLVTVRHLGIGGVLEPVQALPVIVEDNCFVGSRAILVEGVHVESGAVIR